MLDKLIIEFDKVIKALSAKHVSNRPHPDCDIENRKLSVHEQQQSLRLMRVNHCGEVCAQALYQGQALTSRNKASRSLFEQAAFEETEHLAWVSKRIGELGGRASILNPLFYLGSLSMGIGAGLLGDKWSLGFLEETEMQVGQHLSEHLEQLPSSDLKSRAILQQMKQDEDGHAEMAHANGALQLPGPIRLLMELSSKVMTKTTYYI